MSHKKDLELTKSEFDQFAKDYDLLYPDWEKVNEKIAQGIDRVIKEINSKIINIVDLGCGTGLGTIGLAKMGYNVTGVDISKGMLNTAKEKSERINVQIELLEADFLFINDYITFRPDLILCRGNSIDYLFSVEDLGFFLEGIYNLLTKGGFFYLGMRDWTKFLSINKSPFYPKAELLKYENYFYNISYEWSETDQFIYLVVTFKFYDPTSSELIFTKKYPVTIKTYSLDLVMEQIKKTGFDNIRIIDVPEEKLEGEEYTIICGTRGL